MELRCYMFPDRLGPILRWYEDVGYGLLRLAFTAGDVPGKGWTFRCVSSSHREVYTEHERLLGADGVLLA